MYVASLATQSLAIAYGCSPSRYHVELYLQLLLWTFKTFSAYLLATVAHYLSRPWFFFTALLALYTEFFPLSISDAYFIWLFSLFAVRLLWLTTFLLHVEEALVERGDISSMVHPEDIGSSPSSAPTWIIFDFSTNENHFF